MSLRFDSLVFACRSGCHCGEVSQPSSALMMHALSGISFASSPAFHSTLSERSICLAVDVCILKRFVEGYLYIEMSRRGTQPLYLYWGRSYLEIIILFA
jgi:hypothetical protein